MSNIENPIESSINVKSKRVLIHTGPGKTGSSAVQAWLSKNRTFLNKQGILYPKHPVAKSQISSGNLRAILSQFPNSKMMTPGEQWYVDSEKVKVLLDGFYASDAKVLLLSSEFFFHRIVDIEKVIPEAEFIAYIRNPVELLESNYNQGVKRHGNTGKFSAPKALDKYFWQYLSNVFKKVDANKLFLRPYDESLMVGNNIVSDVLAVIGIEHDVDNKRINPSFTFSSLEFKRLLNHFELGSLEPKLDVLLQGCRLGTPVYSLMERNDFERLNKQSCQAMQVFIEKYQQNHLNQLLINFKGVEQSLFRQQKANLRELSAVAEYLHNKAQPFYFQLKALVSLHHNILIDNPIIFDVFNVKPVPESRINKSESQLLTVFEGFSLKEGNQEKVAHGLTNYFSSTHNWGAATLFAKVAYSYNTKKVANQILLNRVLIAKNLSDDRARSVEVKPSYRSRVKNILIAFRRVLKRYH